MKTLKIFETMMVLFISMTIFYQPAFSQEKVYTKADIMPSYPGGKLAIAKFIKDNLIYPEEAKTANVKGTVVVCFIVEKTGGRTSIEVINGIGSGCDEEAMRLVRKMKTWIPGTIGGKAVRVKYKLSIVFPQT